MVGLFAYRRYRKNKRRREQLATGDIAELAQLSADPELDALLAVEQENPTVTRAATAPALLATEPADSAEPASPSQRRRKRRVPAAVIDDDGNIVEVVTQPSAATLRTTTRNQRRRRQERAAAAFLDEATHLPSAEFHADEARQKVEALSRMLTEQERAERQRRQAREREIKKRLEARRRRAIAKMSASVSSLPTPGHQLPSLDDPAGAPASIEPVLAPLEFRAHTIA